MPVRVKLGTKRDVFNRGLERKMRKKSNGEGWEMIGLWTKVKGGEGKGEWMERGERRITAGRMAWKTRWGRGV